DDVHERRAREERFALLARDAAADADDRVRAGGLELPPSAEQREHLLLCLLADRARVEEQDIRVVRTLGRDGAEMLGEHVGHLGRVVLVHLAPEGLNEKALRQRASSLNALRPRALEPDRKSTRLNSS